MICYIMGAGEFSGYLPQRTKSDILIAADAGLRLLDSLGVKPDLIIGDFDSYGEIPKRPETLVFPKEKDDTDMLLAVKEGLSRGYKVFHMYGGLGGRRLSHTIANIQTLIYLLEHDAEGILFGNSCEIVALKNGSMKFDASYRGFISVFCFGAAASGVTLSGFKYEISDATLTSEMPLGVSNEFLGCESEVRVSNGTLIIVTETE